MPTANTTLDSSGYHFPLPGTKTEPAIATAPSATKPIESERLMPGAPRPADDDSSIAEDYRIQRHTARR